MGGQVHVDGLKVSWFGVGLGVLLVAGGGAAVVVGVVLVGRGVGW